MSDTRVINCTTLDEPSYHMAVSGGSRLIRIGLYTPNGNVWDGAGGMSFSKEQAIKAGVAIIEAAGGKVADPDAFTRASDITLNESLIRVAAVHGRVVMFRYAKTDTSPIESRKAIPSAIEKHGESTLFVGQDPDRGDYRSFRLDRIKGDVGIEA